MELIIVPKHMSIKKEKNILILAKAPTDGLDGLNKVAAKPKYFSSFTETTTSKLCRFILQWKQQFFC